jgi:hypothetical protein
MHRLLSNLVKLFGSFGTGRQASPLLRWQVLVNALHGTLYLLRRRGRSLASCARACTDCRRRHSSLGRAAGESSSAPGSRSQCLQPVRYGQNGCRRYRQRT